MGREGLDPEKYNWLTIRDRADSVTADVTRIRNHPLGPSDIAIYGYIPDVTSGRLVEVEAATSADRTG